MLICDKPQTYYSHGLPMAFMFWEFLNLPKGGSMAEYIVLVSFDERLRKFQVFLFLTWLGMQKEHKLENKTENKLHQLSETGKLNIILERKWSLLGHKSPLQNSFSNAFPLHLWPPYCGCGLEHSRVLCRRPPLQETLQGVQLPQGDHFPSTVWKTKGQLCEKNTWFQRILVQYEKKVILKKIIMR